MPKTPDRTPGPALEEELQLEDNGANPSVDGAITFNGGAFVMRDSAGNFDPRSGGGGITENQHRQVDQLVHEIRENSFTEFEKTGNQVDAIRIYTDSGKSTKIREQEFTYTGNKVTQIVTKQYDGGGLLVEKYTETISYTGNTVDNITGVFT